MALPAWIPRDGELTEQSLVDAVATERGEGRRPSQIAVSTPELERRACAILAPDDSVLGDLRAVVANVLVDPLLPEGSWELRSA